MPHAGVTAHVRHQVLARLEAGVWGDGAALPGARDLAAELGVSFLKVQQAVATLATDGVLELRPRVGAFVRPGWRERVLADNLSVFNQRQDLPWADGLEAILARELPGLRLTDAFPRSLIEIKTLPHVQQHHDRYLDLAPLVEPLLAQAGPLHEGFLAPCRVGGRLIGLPLIASPRVLAVNPGVLAAHGLPEPGPDWGWEDFLALVRRLAGAMDPALVLNLDLRPYWWLSLVFAAGGRLFTGDPADPVAVDRPEARRGLHAVRALWQALGRPDGCRNQLHLAAFAAGRAPFALVTRQDACRLARLGAGAWTALPLPAFAGGVRTSSQAADLLCVRDACADPELVQRALALALGPEVQGLFGALGYGIPLSRVAAVQSLALGDPRDRLFLSEQERVSWEPCQEHPELTRFIMAGVDRLLRRSDDIDRDCLELARAARLLHAVLVD